MAQTIRRHAKPARRQAKAQASRTKVRQAKKKTSSLIDALMRVLPFTEEQLQRIFAAAGLTQSRVVPLSPESDAKGPALFIATAVR